MILAVPIMAVVRIILKEVGQQPDASEARVCVMHRCLLLPLPQEFVVAGGHLEAVLAIQEMIGSQPIDPRPLLSTAAFCPWGVHLSISADSSVGRGEGLQLCQRKEEKEAWLWE